MVAYVEYQGNGTYALQLRDHSLSHADWTWYHPITVQDTRTPFTAEWVVESGASFIGARPMAKFATAKFTGMYYETTTNGVIHGHALTDSGAYRLEAGSPPQTSVAPVGADSSGLISWSNSQ